MKSDIEIAQKATMKPIIELAKTKLGIDSKYLEPYGHYKAKLSLDYLREIEKRPDGKLILVTAISPTPAGEGKTTTTVGLGDALNRIGKKAIICLREPSLGPVFGVKGGAAGGGHAQVVPMEDINLHFTGDFHAIGAAHNLLAAMIDNHINHGNELRIDPRLIQWKRVVDMNDRALRKIVIGLGGTANGFAREDGYDIVVASEIMAVLLKDAIKPNLVQTLENNPAFIHGGPFANIAHGCNSVTATRTALKLADYCVTEAGFGADLGAEKFIDIKCRMAGLNPSAVVLVATIRALKFHGGVRKEELNKENLDALARGMVNIEKHLTNIRDHYGLPCVVSVNHFTFDTDAEIKLLKDKIESLGGRFVVARHWAHGGAGAEDLAHAVIDVIEKSKKKHTYVYEDHLPLTEKIKTIATKIYGAGQVTFADAVKKQLDEWNKDYGHFPICMAKTQMSFTADPSVRGAPTGHTLNVREVRLSNGAGFVVAICGDLMTMPGLPKVPAAEKIDIDEHGNIVGLF